MDCYPFTQSGYGNGGIMQSIANPPHRVVNSPISCINIPRTLFLVEHQQNCRSMQISGPATDHLQPWFITADPSPLQLRDVDHLAIAIAHTISVHPAPENNFTLVPGKGTQ